MHDNAISASKLAAYALWAWVALLFAVAWLTWAFGDHETLWMMFAFTGCASSALAATFQVRCYSLRVCALLRATHGLDTPPPSEVRALR